MTSYLSSPVLVVLRRVGAVETDSRHQETCLLAVNDIKRNQGRITHDVDEMEGLM